MFMKKVIIISALVSIVGCSSTDKGFSLEREPGSAQFKTRNWENLNSEDIASVMQGESMTACFGIIKESFALETERLKKTNPPTTTPPVGQTNANDAMIEMSRNQTKMFEMAMKYQSHTVAYMSGVQPLAENPIMQLAKICKSNNYFDMKMKQSDNRYAFATNVVNTVTGGLVGVAPWAAVGYAIKKGYDKAGTSVNGEGNNVNVNSGSGNQNNAGGIPLNPADVNPVTLSGDQPGTDEQLAMSCEAAGGTINDLGECSDGMGGNPLMPTPDDDPEQVGELPAPEQTQ